MADWVGVDVTKHTPASTRAYVVACFTCGIEFEYRLKNGRHRSYCSRPCFYKGLSATKGGAVRDGVPQRKVVHDIRACLVCGEEYEALMWNQKWCPTCVPNKRARARIQRYGISGRDWDRMVAEQGGKCAICRTREPNVVDHDHRTGKTRRPLCSGCNMALGRFEEDGWVALAQQYLAEQAAIHASGGESPNATPKRLRPPKEPRSDALKGSMVLGVGNASAVCEKVV